MSSACEALLHIGVRLYGWDEKEWLQDHTPAGWMGERHGSPHPALDRTSLCLYWYLLSAEEDFSNEEKLWLILTLGKLRSKCASLFRPYFKRGTFTFMLYHILSFFPTPLKLLPAQELQS